MLRMTSILLTGATGFLGRYVLRDLLNAGAFVTVLARERDGETADQRVRAALSEITDVPHPQESMRVLAVDDEYAPRSDRARRELLDGRWNVIHAAGSVQFFSQENGDPWRTNVHGTRKLLGLLGRNCSRWIQVSTAFISPIREGIAYEQPTRPATFRCPYEASKYEADRIVLAGANEISFPAAIVRPGVIVGEFETGRTTSYEGFYGPMQALARLVRNAAKTSSGSVHLPLRYNIKREAVRNLVPIDWVSETIRKIALSMSELEGVLHLTPERATSNGEIDAAMKRAWHFSGTEFAEDWDGGDMNSVERLFYRVIKRVAPNWPDEPSYDNQRLQGEPEYIPCPRVDSQAVERLLGYAERADWGAAPTAPDISCSTLPAGFPCAEYLEKFLPTHAPESLLPRLANVTTNVAFHLAGRSGGSWICQIVNGNVVSVTNDSLSSAPVNFHTTPDTFGEIVSGRISPQQAFFDRRIEISGDIETGLKLAMIFEKFVCEFPFDRSKHPGIALVCHD
jgi:nucleoside-diphosphate-sugar epimerase